MVVRPSAIFALLAVALSVSCMRTEERRVLPWFKVKTTRTSPIGGLSGGTSTTEYFIRVHGFWWKKLDDAGVGGAVALNPEAIFYFHNGEAKLIHQGETMGRLACGGARSGASLPPGAGVVDCVDVLAGPAAAVATRIRFQRISAAGRVLNQKTISADGPDRVFLQPMVTFYDERGTAYFVVLNEKLFATPDCTLVAVDAGESKWTAGPAGMSGRDCSEASAWMKAGAPPLKRATGR